MIGAKEREESHHGSDWPSVANNRGAAWIKNGVVELTSRSSGISEELTPESTINKLISIYR